MLKLRKCDLHENLQKLYSKQLSNRFNIEAYVVPPPQKEGVMSLSSADGHWIIYIDTFSWLKKLYPQFSKFSKKDSLLRFSKSIFCELTDTLIIPELPSDISFFLSEHEPSSLEGKRVCCFESEVGLVLIKQMPLSRASVELNSLFHTVEFSLGYSYLSLESLKKISIGDVIIVQTLCNLILCNQENIGHYIVNDNNEVQMNMHSDSNEIIESQDELSPVKLLEYDDINVRVEFVLAEKRMTLNELKKYVSDEIFKLPENVVQEVKIKVNGSLVGRGELVSIENGYGIEVTSWMVKETVHAE